MAKKAARAKLRSQREGTPQAALLASMLQQAVSAHERGRLDIAQGLYREILRLQPRHPDALLLLGHLCLHARQAQEAIALTRRAIAANPRHPGAHFNLGMALLKTGENRGAAASFEQAVALTPDYAEALCNRGIALQNLGQHDEAIASFDRAIGLAPDDPVAHNNRGISLQKLGQHPQAVAAFDRALELGPDNGVAHNNRGIALLALKQYGDALASFDRALALLPDYAEAHSNRGLVLQRSGRHEEAIASFDRALQLNPANAAAHSGRGMTLLKLGRDGEAMASLDRALAAAPGSADALSNRGVALRKVGRYEDALRCFEQALAVRPEHAETLSNCGNLLRDLNRNAEALVRYEAALASDPDGATTHLNTALCLLLLGQFERGWREFEWRWRTDQYRDAQRDFPPPLWLGKEDLHGRTLLLHAEQGLGDTIQLCRYAEFAAVRGATVLLEVQPPLKPLLEGLAHVSRVLAKGEPLPAFDCHCPLLSLPLAFATRPENIPAPARYLPSHATRNAAWQARLGERRRPRVGLAWAGNAAFGNDRHRSLALATVAKLLDDHAQFVSLQKEVPVPDRPLLDIHADMLHFGDELRDFADTAALVEQMDLIISVDTAIAHLAGALDKPVWILLPVNCDWRWQLDRADSPWYPSARLFRQSRLGDWDSVIEGVAAELSAFLMQCAN